MRLDGIQLNKSDLPRLLGIHMLYLKWLEFARVVRVSVEIVVEGFEYLQNTGSQLILFKK